MYAALKAQLNLALAAVDELEALAATKTERVVA